MRSLPWPTEVVKVTPKYDHIISDDRFVVALAKKHILGWPSRSQLNDSTVALHRAIADASRIYTTLVPGNTLTEDDQFKAFMQVATSALTDGMHAVTVIAALSILFEQEGEDQPHKATY
jgi:hypothetical protein